jgi:DNA-binding transcriptional ArsR family regulator
MRALSRDLEEQINSVKRELDSLEELNILKSREESKRKYFFLNKNFFLMEEFKNIFLKTYNPYNSLKSFFKTQDALELVLINEELSKRLI